MPPILATILMPAIRVLRLIPWQVWGIAAVLIALWGWGQHREKQGREEAVAACNEAVDVLRSEAIKRIQAEQAKVRALEAKLRQRFADAGESARLEIRAEFGSIRDRVIRESHAIQVPAGCPVSVPIGVREQLQTATNRANAASGSL